LKASPTISPLFLSLKFEPFETDRYSGRDAAGDASLLLKGIEILQADSRAENWCGSASALETYKKPLVIDP
jgi:hypothetical protein